MHAAESAYIVSTKYLSMKISTFYTKHIFLWLNKIGTCDYYYVVW